MSHSPLDWLAWLGNLTRFAAKAVPQAVAAVPRPQWWLKPLYDIALGGLPLAAVTGITLGVVIWLHTRDVLARTGTGAVEYLPTFLSAAVLLELAPVGAGLIVAARTGGQPRSRTRLRESRRTTGRARTPRRLAAQTVDRPRILACILGTPMLYIAIAGIALASGFAAESVTGHTTYLKYDAAAMRELYLNDVLPAAMKTLAFGLVVGVTGCFLGLTAEHGSEGVGKAATDSVVMCVLLVLASDVLLVGAIKSLQSLM